MRHGKIVLSIHFADQEKILIKNPILRKLELKVINQYVNHVVFLSEKTKNAFIKTGLNESKASVLYTFHNFGGAILEKSSIGLNAPLRILFVGSIDRRKGILDLLEALSQSTSSDYILDICGQINDKSIKDKYEQMKDILGEKIVEHGYVTGELKKRIFQQADVLVLPSYGEGMPIVIMEAMASGNAIICTNVGAIPEIIKPENGFLLKPGDIEALRNSIMLLNSDRELLETMKKTNRKTGQEYDLYSNVRKLCSIYGELQ